MGVQRNPAYRRVMSEGYVILGNATIKEVHKRRFLLLNVALEIFLTNGKTYLLAFETVAQRDAAYDKVRYRRA